MKKRRKRKYILVARYENVFAGLGHWGIVFWSGAVVGEAWETVRARQVVFAYGCMRRDSACDPRHGFHVVIGKICEEVFGVFVFNARGEGFPSSFDLHPAFPPV